MRRGYPTGGDVLFVYDEPGAWTRYRCDHAVEQLRLRGAAADTVQSSSAHLSAAADRYGSLVLNRVAWTDELGALLERARARGQPVLFDTDDLVFEPGLIDHLAAFDGWPERDRLQEAQKLARYRRTLEACDAATVTTEPLAELARAHVARVEVAHNVVSDEMMARAERVRSRRGDEVTLAYLSGTRSHNRDFLEAADAVLWCLETQPSCRLLIVGKLDLDARFDGFGRRVERLPLQPWRELPRILARVDVNLAPLERDNPFARCKSCVKYLEAGLLAVPTVASRRPDFVRVIEDGRNGLLADTPDEWRDSLGRLVASPRFRRELGAHAAVDVRERRTTRSQAAAYEEAVARAVGN